MKGLLLILLVATLHLPKDKVGVPVLVGSRIVEVNRDGGKVFGSGQRNLTPVLMQFRKNGPNAVSLRRIGFRSPHGMVWRGSPRGRKKRHAAELYPIVEERADTFVIDISRYFSTYPESLSAIPPRELHGRAVSHEILSVRETDRYLEVTVRYRYGDGLELTAACWCLFLKENPMQVRIVDPEKAGYNGVEYRRPEGGRIQVSQRWDLSDGKTIDFYVDKAFPAEWYPYIKEGIEDWNRAFERIGFGKVITVQPEPEDGSLDRYSPLVNMVRFMDLDESNAKGDVLVDPRSGEILQGDILWWRNVLDRLCDWRYVQTGAADPAARLENYPMEILGPMIRYSICHEMGHVLGLSHNMGASWAYPADSLRSPSFTQEYGTTASVMDYARFNHLATEADIAAGVSLLPPRLGPYDYYAIALGYGETEPEPGNYCYFAPFYSAAISPDPSAQAETLGDDLLRSSEAGIGNCCALLGMDGLTKKRTRILRRQYYQYVALALSNIGGTINGQPVDEMTRNKTLRFVFDALDNVPQVLKDEHREQRILNELSGNFLPERILRTCGENSLKRYEHELQRYAHKHPDLAPPDENE
ncbi:MAG: zinc-dependent metalloprotease [Bacteroidales bacterium]|nr:zinc-dependent metalloprotease [Bacteroidales bacterium]